MEKQLVLDVGGDTTPVKPRGKHYVQPRGYAYMPGTGPAGETCGTCKHIHRYRRWAKCGAYRGLVTHGRGTDILVRAKACKYWEKPDVEEKS